MGNRSELSPPDYGFPLWTVYAVWVGVLLLLYRMSVFARLSSVATIGGSRISDLLQTTAERLQRDAVARITVAIRVYTHNRLVV